MSKITPKPNRQVQRKLVDLWLIENNEAKILLGAFKIGLDEGKLQHTPVEKSLKKRLERAESALKVIHAWATFQGGTALDPRDTAKLCRKALDQNKLDA